MKRNVAILLACIWLSFWIGWWTRSVVWNRPVVMEVKTLPEQAVPHRTDGAAVYDLVMELRDNQQRGKR